jgi:ribonuclease P protein component
MNKIKRSDHIQKILDKRNAFGNQYFTLVYLENNAKEHQFAVLVGKKLGNAVVRNYLKRKYRQLIRNHISDEVIFIRYDILIIPKIKSIDVEYAILEKQFKKIVVKLGELDVKK